MRLPLLQLILRIILSLPLFLTAGCIARAQEPASDGRLPNQSEALPPDDSSPSGIVTIFPHSDTSRYWVSGQANLILQWHPSFSAKYSGVNSLHSYAENATSQLYTLYFGYELTNTTEVFVDGESAGGHGISDALGLAGFTNLDVVRNPDLGPTPYLARFIVRQIIPLSDERVEAARGVLALATSLPARRIELRAGKFTWPISST
jgi:high affinity Mn2+ porin